MQIKELLYLPPIGVVIAIAFAVYLVRDVLSRETGTDEMRHVSDVIYEGAIAFLKRQYTTIGLLAIVTAIVIGVLVSMFSSAIEVRNVTPAQFGVQTAIAFLLGALLSSVSGIIAMWTAVKSNVRVAAAARHGVDRAPPVAPPRGAGAR